MFPGNNVSPDDSLHDQLVEFASDNIPTTGGIIGISTMSCGNVYRFVYDVVKKLLKKGTE